MIQWPVHVAGIEAIGTVHPEGGFALGLGSALAVEVDEAIERAHCSTCRTEKAIAPEKTRTAATGAQMKSTH
jgi:hypothetical protein